MSDPIEKIWPEAFNSGQSVRLSGVVQKHEGFVKAWFYCRDGRSYNLSKEELLRYKPDAKISKSYWKLKK